jgi:hypothetical protein
VMLGMWEGIPAQSFDSLCFSFGVYPNKRHHGIGFAEFPGITEYIELRKSKHIWELPGS